VTEPVRLALPEVPDWAMDPGAYLLGADGDRYMWLPGGVWEAIEPRAGGRWTLGTLLEREGGSVLAVPPVRRD